MKNAKEDLEKMFPAKDDESLYGGFCEICRKWLKEKDLLAAAIARQPCTICRACAEDFEDGRYIRLRH